MRSWSWKTFVQSRNPAQLFDINGHFMIYGSKTDIYIRLMFSTFLFTNDNFKGVQPREMYKI